MAKLIVDLAQTVIDDYYQGLQPQEGFFDINDAARALVDERDALLQAEFYAEKQRRNTDYPTINPQWYKTVFVPVEYDQDLKHWFANICEPITEFPEDAYGMGISTVNPTGQECSQFVRITNSQTWEVCLTASTDWVFFSIQGCQIFLHNFFGCCDKLAVQIVPSQSGLPLNQQTAPDGKAAMIREAVLNKWFRNFGVRNGKIQQINQGNGNSAPNETSLTYADLKTK